MAAIDDLPQPAEQRELTLMRLMRERRLDRDEVILLHIANLSDAVQHWQGRHREARAEAERLRAALWLAEARLAAWEGLAGWDALRHGPAASQDRASATPAPRL